MLAPTCIVRTTSRVGPRQGPPVTADYLPAVPLAGSYKVMGELREIISEIAPDSSNPLLLEEYGAQLLDQIEHMARASQDAAAPARPSTS